MAYEAKIANTPGRRAGTPQQLERALTICKVALRAHARTVIDITPLPTLRHTVLRVDLTNGQRIKLRFSPAPAERIRTDQHRLAQVIPGRFPTLLACDDGWAAYEWIAGCTVAEAGAPPAVVDDAAKLLWAMHQGKVAPGHAGTARVKAEVSDRMDKCLPVLERHGLLSVAQSSAVRDLADAVMAQDLPITLIHGDFAPTNLVLAQDRMVTVDNERLCEHVALFDLCRAANFWDEWNGSGRVLRATYERLSGYKPSGQAMLLWTILDLAYRTSFRLRYFGERSGFCSERLSELVTARLASA